MAITLGEKMRLDVLHPPSQLLTNTASDANNNSVVLRLEHDRFSILLTGDIMAEAENTLLTSGQALDSLVLKVPHHGADTSLSEAFLEAVSPQVAVISVGVDNRFGHPSEVTLEKLEGIAAYRTDLDSSIEVVSDGSVYWLRTEK